MGARWGKQARRFHKRFFEQGPAIPQRFPHNAPVSADTPQQQLSERNSNLQFAPILSGDVIGRNPAALVAQKARPTNAG